MTKSVQKRIVYKLKYGKDPVEEINDIKECCEVINIVIKAGPRKGIKGFDDIWIIEYLKAAKTSMTKRSKKMKKEFKL